MTTKKQLFAAAGVLGLCLFAVTATSSRAFDGKTKAANQIAAADEASTQDVSLLQKADKKKKKKKRKKARGRLPNYYAKVGISEEQRKKIYAVQASYRDKIAALTKELNELKGKRNKEVEAVLTEEQRKKVKDLVDAARRARSLRAAKRKAGKTKSKSKD